MDRIRYLIIPLTTALGVAGFLLGGTFVWFGAATFPVLLLADVILPRDINPRAPGTAAYADFAIQLQLPLMVGLYAAFVFSVNNGSNPVSGAAASVWQIAGSMLSLIWLSTVPTLPVAHELMHRRHWLPRLQAKLLNTFYGDPNRDIAHVMTHHIHLDTRLDSDTPLRGETMYAFVIRATLAAYHDTWTTERTMLVRQGLSPWNWRSRMWLQLGLLASLPLAVGLAGGAVPALMTVAVMTIAKLFLEGFNYFQHYGLLRIEGEPILKHHAWNHMGMIARPLGAEITNHINHHLDGHTPFYALQPEPEAPQMPSLFLCFVCGLVPPLWHRYIAQPRLKDWDLRYALPAERVLAAQANRRAGWPDWTGEAGVMPEVAAA